MPCFSAAFPLGRNTLTSRSTLCLYLIELCGTCVTPSLPSLPPSPSIPSYLCVLTFDLCPVGFASSLFTALAGLVEGEGRCEELAVGEWVCYLDLFFFM